ncbi:MAG: hypothetical protein R3Y62_00905 [Eubacteriales bacterium]
MWIGKKVAENRVENTNAKMGTVTVGGTSPTVSTDREERQLQVVSPGGFWWRPASEDAVLVVEGAVVGCMADCPVTLAAGEVYMGCNGASIHMRNDGGLYLGGTIYINNVEWEG